MAPILYIVIPCYNEQAVLPITHSLFLDKLMKLIENKKVSDDSRVVFVNDGSSDNTWSLICSYAENNKYFKGISLSRNRGHQNALLAGLMDSIDKCDITISIDCDGQDDINAMDKMVDEYLGGAEVVYGVRSQRKTDTFFKRTSAQTFYKLMSALGADTVYNHADYRLMSSKVLREFANFKEVNLFLRGMVPLVGFKSTCVTYERTRRMAGESHYPLVKMINFALNGITSFSVKPIRLIFKAGLWMLLLGVIAAILLAVLASGAEVAILASVMTALTGIQLIAIGIIGEYIGKNYMETKARPRFIISERTDDK